MIAYLDSSVVLRVALGEPRRLREWNTVEQGVASSLVEVECLRTLDRLQLASRPTRRTLAAQREAVFSLLEGMDVVELDRAILSRAAMPLPVPLGTLDALHLATALTWRELAESDLVMATHDAALAAAARASGLRVVGA